MNNDFQASAVPTIGYIPEFAAWTARIGSSEWRCMGCHAWQQHGGHVTRERATECCDRCYDTDTYCDLPVSMKWIYPTAPPLPNLERDYPEFGMVGEARRAGCNIQ
jgi:hypothetical protein